MTKKLSLLLFLLATPTWATPNYQGIWDCKLGSVVKDELNGTKIKLILYAFQEAKDSALKNISTSAGVIELGEKLGKGMLPAKASIIKDKLFMQYMGTEELGLGSIFNIIATRKKDQLQGQFDLVSINYETGVSHKSLELNCSIFGK